MHNNNKISKTKYELKTSQAFRNSEWTELLRRSPKCQCPREESPKCSKMTAIIHF